MGRNRYLGGFTLGVIMTTVLVFTPMGAIAQSIDRFVPASSQRDGYLGTESGQSYLPGKYEVGAFFYFMSHPLLGYVDQEPSFVVLDHQLVAHVSAAYAPVDWLRLSIDMPFYLLQSGDNEIAVGRQPGELDGAGVGDLRFTLKGTLYDGRAAPERPNAWTPTDRVDGISLGLLAAVTAPLGDESRFQGEEFRVEPMAVFDYAMTNGFGVGLNLGYMIRKEDVVQNIEVADQFTYHLGVRSPLLIRHYRFVGEIFGGTTLSGDNLGLEEQPMEAMIGGQYLDDDIVAGVGWGTGIIQGYGAPDARIWASIAYSPVPPPEIHYPDTDGDGYVDPEDGCPEEPEDFDEFEDEDGCPDADNDRDAIFDINDQCPNDPEDPDGWEDEDGCPDPDNDYDGFRDEEDDCPNEAEVVNNYLDDDGCPDEMLSVEPEEIMILDKIHFDYDSDVIQSRSTRLLDNIAGILLEHPELVKVQVVGHTSGEGDEAYNMNLSLRRAGSVIDALTERGVERSRLEAVGKGEAEPIDNNDNEAGRANNRRVEFLIIERAAQ